MAKMSNENPGLLRNLAKDGQRESTAEFGVEYVIYTLCRTSIHVDRLLRL